MEFQRSITIKQLATGQESSTWIEYTRTGDGNSQEHIIRMYGEQFELAYPEDKPYMEIKFLGEWEYGYFKTFLLELFKEY